MGSILRPDMGKIVWAALGFIVAPKLIRMVRG
jgi:hypothetical protein